MSGRSDGVVMTAPEAASAAAGARPDISVVIPTYNRLPRLRRVLAALADQTVPDSALEVIVVSDGSTDGTDGYLASGQAPIDVRVVRQPNRGPAAARNAGVRVAAGDVVLFLDDDVVPTPSVVQRHLDAHRRHGGDVVVLGPMLTPPDHEMSPWVAYEQAMLDKQYDAMRSGQWEPTPRQFYTGNASVGRRHVVACGGFDETFTRAEDVELAYRLNTRGLRFLFDPEAVGLHYAERSYASWRRTAYLYGRNDVVFATERQQDWLLDAMRLEFAQHHRLIRWVARLTLDRPLRHRLLTGWCEMIARAVSGRGARAALSAVFNLTYYQGVADELGSVRWLFARDADDLPTAERTEG